MSEWVCGAFGPPLQPGMWSYRCSLAADHTGPHEAWIDEPDRRCVDSWPR